MKTCTVYDLSSDTQFVYLLPAEEALISAAILRDAKACSLTDGATREAYRGKIARGKRSISIGDLCVKAPGATPPNFAGTVGGAR
jgi:hypothetical protein